MALRKTSEITTSNISNVSVSIIHITEDKLINILTKHVNNIRKNGDWIGATGLALTLVFSVYSADFKDAFGFSGDTIKGFFVFAMICAVIYDLKVVCNRFCNKDGVEAIMKDIKNENTEKEQE